MDFLQLTWFIHYFFQNIIQNLIISILKDDNLLMISQLGRNISVICEIYMFQLFHSRECALAKSGRDDDSLPP